VVRRTWLRGQDAGTDPIGRLIQRQPTQAPQRYPAGQRDPARAQDPMSEPCPAGGSTGQFPGRADLEGQP
jgi:hypothetical protein